LQSSAGALQRAVDRRRGGVEHLGDLGRREAKHVAQDKRCSLLNRQMLEAGHERKCDGLPGVVASLWARLDGFG
jgi:hypothetical protein